MEPSHRAQFLGSKGAFDEAGLVLFGCPFDQSVSFRSGAARGPEAIRIFSEVLETYSPNRNADLEDIPFFDMGDLPLANASTESALTRIREEAARILTGGKIPFGLGGDHLVSLPMIEAALEVHPDLVVFQWDAHADLRDDYEGDVLSHATVMRRVVEKIGEERIVQFGIRSGTREEWEWMRSQGTHRPLNHETLKRAVADFAGRPVYLTLDLDVLDPSDLPGTGTPEPGGVRYGELMDCIEALEKTDFRPIGLDVVELAPAIDPSGASAVIAAKIVREMVLAFGRRT